MNETEYTPAAEVPALDQLRAAIKAAAKEHPEYGSCPNCIKAVRVDKAGRLRDHNTPELVVHGNMKGTFRCPGSGKAYAEHGDFGERWDLGAGRWVELDVDVPVLLVAHDQAAARGVELPAWQLWPVPPGDVTRRGAKALLDGSKWRIELALGQGIAAARLIRLDHEDGLIVWETQVNGEAFRGTERAIERLLTQLEATDYHDRVAARSE